MTTTIFPKYPIYIVSKGRWESRLTAKAFDRIGVPYYVAVESHEYEKYCSVFPEEIVLDMGFSNHGLGPGVARNWVWDHSIQNGFKRHWVMDDNIRSFRRLYKGTRYHLMSGNFLRACEDFTDRFTNVWISGLQYKFFTSNTSSFPPFVINTRQMSCMLIQNDCPERWRGKYNEDVDISIRVLKAGACTILFYTFLNEKSGTQKIKGGNTEELYMKGQQGVTYETSTFEKSKMLANMHPEIVTLVKRYGRWHHAVDLTGFRNNKLQYVEGYVEPEGNNEYGMSVLQNSEQGLKKVPLDQVGYL